MSKKYVDDFIKLPIEKMAQAISDMTYSFKNTEVPKKHYKDMLSEELISLIANDSTFDLALLKAVADQIAMIRNEQPRLFLLAMLIQDKGIKVDNINKRIYDSLNATFEQNRLNKKILSEVILDSYKENYENHAVEFEMCKELKEWK